MRTRNEIRENGFVVARQYLADAGAREQPIEPVYQLHLDAIDMLAALAEKDAELHQLREDAGDEVDRLQALISAGEVEIERLNTIAEFRKVLNNFRVDEIIELRRTIEELRR